MSAAKKAAPKKAPKKTRRILTARWVCTLCDRDHSTEDGAKGCCTCPDCGKRCNPYSTRCTRCQLVRNLKDTRDRVQEARDHVREAAARLRAFDKPKKPARAS